MTSLSPTWASGLHFAVTMEASEPQLAGVVLDFLMWSALYRDDEPVFLFYKDVNPLRARAAFIIIDVFRRGEAMQT